MTQTITTGSPEHDGVFNPSSQRFGRSNGLGALQSSPEYQDQPVFLIPAAMALMERNRGFIQGLSSGCFGSISRTLRNKNT